MMNCWQVDEFPQASVAWYVRVIVVGQNSPSFTSLTKVTVTEPQLSDAVTREISGAGTFVIHSTKTGPGQVITGAVIS